MRVFAFKGVDALVRERDSLGEAFEHVAVKYFDIAKRYCLNEAELDDLRKLYEMKLKVDILQLTDEMSPLNLATLAAQTEDRRSADWIEKASQALEDESDSDFEENIEITEIGAESTQT